MKWIAFNGIRNRFILKTVIKGLDLLTAIITPECVEITALGKGPGIIDIEQALRESYSTAPENVQKLGFGAGMGLPNMKNNADVMEIDSVFNKGTKLRVKMYFYNNF